MSKPNKALENKILRVLGHTPMNAKALCLAVKASQKPVNAALDALAIAGQVYRPKRGGPWFVGSGDIYKLPPCQFPPEPKSAITVTEIEPGHRVIKFGQGHKCQPALRQHLGIQGASSLCRG